MNKNILRQFQFGFELEGTFSKNIEGKVGGEFKEDGSVHRVKHTWPEGAIYTGDGEEGESCDNCSGEGGFRNDCECESEYNCNHEHDESCAEIVDGVRVSRSSNCTHDCCDDDCPSSTPCEDDDDYHWETCSDCDGEGHRNNEIATEYASSIFKSIADLQAELEIFNEDKHNWNDSCGMHLHVGTKVPDKYKMLWNAVANYDFLLSLQREAVRWCACQKKRLSYSDNHYYQFWQNEFDLIRTFNNKYPLRDFNRGSFSEKFRFMRFHTELSTLEFRFMAPCKHKAQNAEKLLSFLTDYLSTEEVFQIEEQATINQPSQERMEINLRALVRERTR